MRRLSNHQAEGSFSGLFGFTKLLRAGLTNIYGLLPIRFSLEEWKLSVRAVSWPDTSTEEENLQT